MKSTVSPVGFRQLYQDISTNFQMNRWLSPVGDECMLEEMRMTAPLIAKYPDWKREFLALAANATGESHILSVEFYFCAADFLMCTDDADERNAHQKFLDAMRSVEAAPQSC